jgi:hypothetical protein
VSVFELSYSSCYRNRWLCCLCIHSLIFLKRLFFELGVSIFHMDPQ